MVKLFIKFSIAFIITIISTLPLLSAGNTIKPVTPNASPEAKALLEFIYSISGTYTLTGQHNYPNTRDRNSQYAARYIGKTPALWSTDMGFAKDGDTDSYLARPDIVKEAKRQHELGSIVTICWHAVPPTANEPVTFSPRRDANPESLATVQGQLLDQQFKDILTPGTVLHKRWCAQVDSIAVYLKKMQELHVPVLWRPYHEMNGDWFWWGGRHGKYGTAALYRQIYDRLVNHHKLNNLVWVWSMDRPNKPAMHFSHFYPGDKYLDIVALDVYGSDFNQTYYDSLVILANGKPVVLGEVGNPPAPEIINNQPRWACWVVWAGMGRNTTKKQYEILANDSRILFQEDAAYIRAIAPYRAACGLSPLQVKTKPPVNFSGEWILNEEKSSTDNFGGGQAVKMLITHNELNLSIQRFFVVEWGDDRIMEETYTLDGQEVNTEFRNMPRVTTAKLSPDGNTLNIESKSTFTRGEQKIEMTGKEIWTLQENGAILSIKQTSASPRGDRTSILIFDKK